MAIKNILFDLDGTLLPMDLNVFLRDYMKRISMKMAAYGYEPRALVDAIMTGTAAMVKNDGTKTNEECFFEAANAALGRNLEADKRHLEEFYLEEFDKIRPTCGYLPEADGVIKALKAMGYRLVLATNPIFPSIATEKRIMWAGVDRNDFELFTTYENSRLTKPNISYYKEILQKHSLDPAECLMVGNDVRDDMAAGKAGFGVFLLTDCLINPKNEDISRYAHGDYSELIKHFEHIL